MRRRMQIWCLRRAASVTGAAVVVQNNAYRCRTVDVSRFSAVHGQPDRARRLGRVQIVNLGPRLETA